MSAPHAPFARTPEPPYYAVIFTSQRSEADRGYGEMAERMVRLAAQQPGFLGIETVRGADGLGITVSYWASEEAIAAWKAHAEHQAAQEAGKRVWYADYRLRVAKVERAYGKPCPPSKEAASIQPGSDNPNTSPPHGIRIVRCEPNRHAEQILAIFNDAILNSTALYEYEPRTMEMMIAWFEAKSKGNYPVIGIENDSGELMGFGSYGPFRAWPAYKYSVEHSVYVAAPFRGRGIGKRLLQEIIRAAEDQGYHILVGGIDAANSVSIRLHESLGFVHCGTIRQAGSKFGRWLDLVFYQLILSTPADPLDG